MPLGAFITSKELMAKFTFDPPLGHITTFGGHPVSCAAGLAAQKVVEQDNMMDRAMEMEYRYRKGLKHPLIREIRGKGLFLAVKLAEEVNVSDFISQAFKNGLIIDQFLFSDDSFRIAPPLVISPKELDLSMVKVLATLDTISK